MSVEHHIHPQNVNNVNNKTQFHNEQGFLHFLDRYGTRIHQFARQGVADALIFKLPTGLFPFSINRLNFSIKITVNEQIPGIKRGPHINSTCVTSQASIQATRKLPDGSVLTFSDAFNNAMLVREIFHRHGFQSLRALEKSIRSIQAQITHAHGNAEKQKNLRQQLKRLQQLLSQYQDAVDGISPFIITQIQNPFYALSTQQSPVLTETQEQIQEAQVVQASSFKDKATMALKQWIQNIIALGKEGIGALRQKKRSLPGRTTALAIVSLINAACGPAADIPLPPTTAAIAPSNQVAGSQDQQSQTASESVSITATSVTPIAEPTQTPEVQPSLTPTYEIINGQVVAYDLAGNQIAAMIDQKTGTLWAWNTKMQYMQALITLNKTEQMFVQTHGGITQITISNDGSWSLTLQDGTTINNNLEDPSRLNLETQTFQLSPVELDQQKKEQIQKYVWNSEELSPDYWENRVFQDASGFTVVLTDDALKKINPNNESLTREQLVQRLLKSPWMQTLEKYSRYDENKTPEENEKLFSPNSNHTLFLTANGTWIFPKDRSSRYPVLQRFDGSKIALPPKFEQEVALLNPSIKVQFGKEMEEPFVHDGFSKRLVFKNGMWHFFTEEEIEKGEAELLTPQERINKIIEGLVKEETYQIVFDENNQPAFIIITDSTPNGMNGVFLDGLNQALSWMRENTTLLSLFRKYGVKIIRGYPNLYQEKNDVRVATYSTDGTVILDTDYYVFDPDPWGKLCTVAQEARAIAVQGLLMNRGELDYMSLIRRVGLDKAQWLLHIINPNMPPELQDRLRITAKVVEQYYESHFK